MIFRHFALKAKHPRALALAHAAEAAARQGSFWQFADSLFAEQGRSDDPHLWERCERLGLDLERFERDRRSDEVAQHVHQDVRDALRAGATATPTLWVLGYHGSVRNIDVSDLAPRPTGGAGKAVPYEQ